MSSAKNSSEARSSNPELQKEFFAKADQVLGKDNLMDKTKHLIMNDSYQPKTKTFKQEFKDELQNKKQEMVGKDDDGGAYKPQTKTFKHEMREEMQAKKEEMLGKNIDSQNWIENKLMGGNTYNPETETMIHQDMKKVDPCYENFKKELKNKKDEIMDGSSNDNQSWLYFGVGNSNEYNPQTKTFKEEFKNELLNKKTEMIGKNESKQNLFDKTKGLITGNNYNPKTKTNKQEFQDELLNAKKEITGHSNSNGIDQTNVEQTNVKVEDKLQKAKEFVANKIGSDSNNNYESTQFKENSEILDNMLGEPDYDTSNPEKLPKEKIENAKLEEKAKEAFKHTRDTAFTKLPGLNENKRSHGSSGSDPSLLQKMKEGKNNVLNKLKNKKEKLNDSGYEAEDNNQHCKKNNKDIINNDNKNENVIIGVTNNEYKHTMIDKANDEQSNINFNNKDKQIYEKAFDKIERDNQNKVFLENYNENIIISNDNKPVLKKRKTDNNDWLNKVLDGAEEHVQTSKNDPSVRNYHNLINQAQCHNPNVPKTA